MSVWAKLARSVQKTYGTQVDWKERFFICPECGEPIYEYDWRDEEYRDDYGEPICPVCENLLEN